MYSLEVRCGISKVVAESVYDWLLDSHWGFIDYPKWLREYICTLRDPPDRGHWVERKRVISDLERILEYKYKDWYD